MTRSFTAAVAAFVLSALAAATAVLAADQEPAAQMQQGQMDSHHEAMMSQMSSEQLAQMARMMESCNRMMEGMAHPPNPGANAPAAPHR